MRWFLVLFLTLLCALAWCGWKWHDYMDVHGTCYLTLSENGRVVNEPGGVAVYRQTTPGPIGPRMLVLQRPILHVDGHQDYSHGLMLYLGDPSFADSAGGFRAVHADNGDALCVQVLSRNGGYSLFPVDSLPAELLGFGLGTTDTVRWQLSRELQPFPAEPPAIAWWAEPLKILTSP